MMPPEKVALLEVFPVALGMLKTSTRTTAMSASREALQEAAD
jgi:hypothetical protein